jgi:hypothetical protein
MHVNNLGRSLQGGCATVVLLCLLAACGGGGGGGGTSSESSTPTPAATASPGCKEATALKSSLKALTNVDVAKDGVTALTGAVADVATNLAAVVATASSKLQPPIDQVKAALTALTTSLSGLTAHNLRQKAPSIEAALTQVGTATAALASAITDVCPSG